MRFLVFQHIAIEHPGILRDFMTADAIAWDAVELDEGEPIPSLEGYDALIAMGGPMDVWQEEEHPWLVAEKQAIRGWVSEGRPFLGVCLGHQLLADAMGGQVGPMEEAEVGILDVELSPAGQRDPLFHGFAPRGRALQWHGAGVLTPPAGATVLAQSPVCAVQALRVGEAAYGIQYHVEITAQTVPEWGCVPEYAASLETTLGADALAAFQAETEAAMPEFNRDARRLYDNFLSIVRAQTTAAA